MLHKNEIKRILVVDDEPSIGKMLKIKLALEGYEAIVTTSGAEAVRLAEEKKPDLVLLDIVMPGMDGFEVLNRVREFSDVPVIVFTGKPDAAEDAVRLGATDFISKPFMPDKLMGKIREYLDSAR